MHTNGRDDSELSDRVDTVGWGLLFVAIGAVSLVPSVAVSLVPSVPEGAWLIVAGAVMLGTSAIRVSLNLPLRNLTVVVGAVALAAGIFTAAGLTSAVGPVALIVLGLTLSVDALHRPQRRSQGASIAHND